MALGLTDRPWTVAELVDEAMRFDPIEPVPTLPPEPPKPRSPNDPRYLNGERKTNYVPELRRAARGQLRIIRGGRS